MFADLFQWLLGAGRELAVVIISMVPLVALRPFTKFATAYKNKLLAKTDQVTKYARIGLLLFVAIPVPGTGAWSGALIATILKMPKVKALMSILGGVIIAGFIMLAASNGVLGVVSMF